MSISRTFGIFLTLFLTLAGVAAAVFAFGVQQFSPVLPQFESDVFIRLWTIEFFQIFPFAVVATALLAYSQIGGFESNDREHSALSRSAAVVLLILTLGIINALWFGGGEAMIARQIEHYRYISRSASTVLSEARALLDGGRIVEAEERILFHRSILGETRENRELMAELDQLSGEQRRLAGRPSTQPAGARVARATDMREMTLAELIQQAEQFLEDKDFFSAHHFATLAVEQNPNRQDARRVQARALAAIQGEARSISEQGDREIFAAKNRAYQAFRQGATIPERAVEAWYLFRELQQQLPRDPDVVTFAPRALAQAEEISLFVEDARQLQTLTGVQNLFFINRQSPTEVQLFFVENLVRTRGSDILFGVEVVHVSRSAAGAEGGGVTFHQRAPYGKVIRDRLVLRAVYNDDSALDGGPLMIDPVVITGDVPIHMIPLTMSVDEIVTMGQGPAGMERLSLLELLTLSDHGGHSGQFATLLLLQRIIRIIGFFALAMGVAALSYRFRSMYLAGPPFFVLLMLPLILWTMYWLIDMGRTVITVAVNTTAQAFTPSAAILIVVLVVLTLIAMSIATLSRKGV